VKLFRLLSLLVLISCGVDRETVSVINGTDGKDGSSCSVSEALDDTNTLVVGALITCTDGSSQIVLNGNDGQNGAAGANGIQGEPGNSCSISRASGADHVKIDCGESIEFVYDGADGENGEDGEDGAPGLNANGCTLQWVANQGGHGNKYRLTCGSVSTTFTGV